MERIPSHPLTTLVGTFVTVICASCILANIAIIKVMSTNRDLFKLNAYKFMIAIGIADVLYSLAYLIFGSCILARYDLYHTQIPYLATAIDAVVVMAYIAYTLFTIVLAVNRFTMTYSSALERTLFSKTGMKLWFALVMTISLAFFVGCLSRLMGLEFHWQNFVPVHNYDLPYSHILKLVASSMEVYGISFAAILYVLLFAIIAKKRRKAHSQRRNLRRMEYRILVQSFTITAYTFIICFVWHYCKSPFDDPLIWKICLLFSRAFTGAVNPTIYVFANVTIRRRMGLTSLTIRHGNRSGGCMNTINGSGNHTSKIFSEQQRKTAAIASEHIHHTF